MADRSLTLPEEILLLVLTDRTGALLEETHFRFAIAAGAAGASRTTHPRLP